MKDRATCSQGGAPIARTEDNFAIFLAFSGCQSLAEDFTQGFGQITDLPRQKFGGTQAGDLLDFAIEDGDQSSAIGGHDSGGEVLQEGLVVDFCILDLGEQLRVFDRDSELTTKDQQ